MKSLKDIILENIQESVTKQSSQSMFKDARGTNPNKIVVKSKEEPTKIIYESPVDADQKGLNKMNYFEIMDEAVKKMLPVVGIGKKHIFPYFNSVQSGYIRPHLNIGVSFVTPTGKESRVLFSKVYYHSKKYDPHFKNTLESVSLEIEKNLSIFFKSFSKDEFNRIAKGRKIHTIYASLGSGGAKVFVLDNTFIDDLLK